MAYKGSRYVEAESLAGFGTSGAHPAGGVPGLGRRSDDRARPILAGEEVPHAAERADAADDPPATATLWAGRMGCTARRCSSFGLAQDSP